MTSLEQSQASFRPSVSPWLIAVAVTVPTFMEVLDCSITNVALGFIAGELSAAKNDSEWVITSFLSANAIILPLSGWLPTNFEHDAISCFRWPDSRPRRYSAGWRPTCNR